MIEADLMNPGLRNAVLLVASLFYLIGSWCADSEDARRYRVTLFWILIVGAGINGSICDAIRELSK